MRAALVSELGWFSRALHMAASGARYVAKCTRFLSEISDQKPEFQLPV